MNFILLKSQFAKSKLYLINSRNIKDIFDLNEISEMAVGKEGRVVHAIYCLLIERDFVLDDPDVAMLMVAFDELEKRGTPGH